MEKLKRYDIYNRDGRKLYTNLIDRGNYYDWGDNYGFVDKLIIKSEGWKVVETKSGMAPD